MFRIRLRDTNICATYLYQTKNLQGAYKGEYILVLLRK